MECSTILNSTGLLLDILGVLILFKFGLPSKVHTPSKLLLEGDITEKQKNDNKKTEKWAYSGLLLLIIGFALQLASNFL